MERLRSLIEAHDARALVVVAGNARDPDLAPFVGSARLGQTVLVVPRSGDARLAYWTPLEREEAEQTGLSLLSPETMDLARWARDGAPASALLTAVLERSLQHCGLAPGRIALAGHASAGTLLEACRPLIADGWSFVDGAPWLASWRRQKRQHELAEMRRVAAVTCDAMRRVAQRLAEASPATDATLYWDGRPLTVGDLRQLVAVRLAADGLDQPEGNLIAPGAQGAVPHNTGDDGTALRAGESLIVDLFPRGRLFTDMTRTFCVGEPPEALVAAYRAVHDALTLAREAVTPGISGFALQQQVCTHFAQRGYPNPIDDPGSVRGYVHGLGHGLGYEVHELPSFRQNAESDGTIEIGDVFTLEPGLYDPEAGYAVRLEDTCYLSGDSTSLEILTPVPYDLDPRAWG